MAKGKSFTRAANALELPKSTVSRRIAELERAIGLRLLKRTTQKVELTEEGLGYFARCQRIVEDAGVAHEELTTTRHHARGHLRVACSADFGLRLVSGLPELCKRHAELSVQFDFTSRLVDPRTENCDVSIHVGALPDSHLTARKIAEIPEFVYASPKYLRGRKAPAAPQDLHGHECIREAQADGGGIETHWTLINGERRVEVPVQGRLSMNSIGIIYALTAARLLPAKTRAFMEFLERELRL